jgi:hypothetical protein
MKTNLRLPLLLCFLTAPLFARSQSAVFTYQGRLLDGGAPANGSYDLRFGLTDAVTNGNFLGPVLTNVPVAISNGLFFVTLDFGVAAFDGSARWLEIGVRTNGSAGAYATVSPRQAVTAAPYATFATAAAQASLATNLVGGGTTLTSVPAASLVGTIPIERLAGITANQIDSATWQSATNTATNIVAALAAMTSGRDDLNRWSWANTLRKIGQRQPIQIMMLGDSVASGTYFPLLSTLQKIYGNGGGNGAGGALLFNMVPTPPAVQILEDQSVWFQSFCRLTNGGIITWFSYSSISVTGNVLEVDYIAKGGAGSFKIQTNLNNSVWNDVAGYTTVNADNGGAPAGMVIRITNAVAAPFQIRVIGLAGVVDFPGGGIVDYTKPGVIMNDFTKFASDWYQLLDVPDAVKAPILRSWAPDLMLATFRDWPMALQEQLPRWHTFLTNYLPNTDFVILGVPPIEDNDQYWSVELNQAARSNAQYFGWGYFDGYHIFGNFASGLASGLLQTGTTHPTTAGYNHIANTLFNWLGLADNAQLGFWNAPGVARGYSGGDLTTTGNLDLTGLYIVRGSNGAMVFIPQDGSSGNWQVSSPTGARLTIRDHQNGTDVTTLRNDTGTYSFSPAALAGVPVDLGRSASGQVWWNVFGTNGFFFGSVNAGGGFSVGPATGLTTNLDVLSPGGQTNQLQFKGGILTGVVPR